MEYAGEPNQLYESMTSAGTHKTCGHNTALVSMSAVCQPYIRRMSAVCQPWNGRMSAVYQLYVGRISAVCQPSVSRGTAVCQPYVRRMSAIPNLPICLKLIRNIASFILIIGLNITEIIFTDIVVVVYAEAQNMKKNVHHNSNCVQKLFVTKMC